MKKRVERYLFVCLLASSLLFAGCSYLTDFVVVNASDHAIEVHYKIKKPSDPLSPSRLPLLPSVKATPQLDQRVPWRELANSDYKFDPNNRTVVVSLMPGQALRIAQYNLADGPASDTERAAMFFVEEVSIAGASGEILINGEQVFKSFVPESQKIYSLTYR